MWEEYEARDVQVLVIDVMEKAELARSWASSMGFTFPVLHDFDGKFTEQFAPEGVLPDLPRNQIPIASNLIIDPEGKIQFFSLLDTTSFDAKLVALRARLDELLGFSPPPPTALGSYLFEQ